MAQGTFNERILELQRRVGQGKITAEVRVDQIYAQYQHQRLDLRHPRGGGPMYLTNAIMANQAKYYKQIADVVLNKPLVPVVIRIANNLSRESQKRTPIFLADLRKSHQPIVKESGRVVYRGPARRRLNKTELRAKARLYSRLNRRSR